MGCFLSCCCTKFKTFMDKEFYVEGLIPEVMSFVGDPKVWEQIIPNMKGFCVNEEKDFFTVDGPTDCFGFQPIWGNKLTGVRYFNFARFPDANFPNPTLSYNCVIGGSMPENEGLGEAKDYTFLFDVCYYMKAGEGKNEGKTNVRRVITNFEQRNLKWFPLPLVIPLKIKMLQENWFIKSMLAKRAKEKKEREGGKAVGVKMGESPKISPNSSDARQAKGVFVPPDPTPKNI